MITEVGDDRFRRSRALSLTKGVDLPRALSLTKGVSWGLRQAQPAVVKLSQWGSGPASGGRVQSAGFELWLQGRCSSGCAVGAQDLA
ncbi:MAG TPA: hypothetical protein DCM67_07055 [Propionibacteriaceae bacterium]|nr:hypothetical protein [Propionibacteriaceae bacterium]